MGAPAGVDLVVAKLHEYLAVPAVVGYEGPFLRHLAADFGAAGRRVTAAPGILAIDGPADEPILTAHVDRHGIVATGGGRFGYAAHVVKAAVYAEEVAVSGRFAATACSRLADERVVAYDPESGEGLGSGTTAHRCEHDAEVELAVAGLEDLPAGTPAGFALGCTEVGNLVVGQLDNTLSAAMAYALVAGGFPGRIVLTTREEVGWSARHFLDFAASAELRPSRELVVLDTSPFPDRGPVDEGVVVLRARDATADFAPELVARLGAAATAAGLPHLYKDRVLKAAGHGDRLGRTELGRIAEMSGGAWNGATVQAPTCDYHTNSETTSRVAIANVLDLLTLATAGS